jgi:predicted PolB exonuclease-like 3'-5' exonuclease
MTALNIAAGGTREESEVPRYLILDTESVPDGRLLKIVKYPHEDITEEDAVRRAQADARERSQTGSDFLPVSFQYPIAACVIRVGADFRLQSIRALDSPEFRPREIVCGFWQGIARFPNAQLVTFNGRGFDLPLLELAAFRYGCDLRGYLRGGRDRYRGNHLDLMDWVTNFGASRLAGGLNLLSKLLGKPGKMEVAGDQVYEMYLRGERQAINDYCIFDTLDTYFVFLRTRVMAGELSLEREQALVRDEVKSWIASKVALYPALERYLGGWGDWNPWP